MKRLILAIIGGVLFPVLYFGLLVILGNAAIFIFKFTGRSSGFRDWAKSVDIFLPISWASYVYFYFFPPEQDFIAFTGFELGNIISLIIGNFLLYLVISYAILSIWAFRVTSKLA